MRTELQTDVPTIRPSASAVDALGLMRQCRVHHLVVMDGPDVVGVVSDQDVIAGGLSERCLFLDPCATVNDVMTPLPGDTLPVDADASEALRLMRLHSCTALPIVRNGRLVGLVTQTDLIGVLEGALAGKRQAPLAAVSV